MHPARHRPAFLSAALAALAAVLALVLPATASAATSSAARPRVGALTTQAILTVGSSQLVSPGQGRDEARPQAQFAAGAYVAAEDTSVIRVFWTGGEEAKAAATSFAVENGGETIGMTAEGRALEAATQDMPWVKAQPLWNDASQSFAERASGETHVFINLARANPESIWANTELPALVNNLNVTDVIFHLLGG